MRLRNLWIVPVSSLILCQITSVHANEQRVVEPSDAGGLATETSVPQRVIVNIPERVLRAYTVEEGIDDYTEPWVKYRVAVGQKRFPTPSFDGKVLSRRAKPTWFVPRTGWAGELAGQVIPFFHHENPFRTRNAEGRAEGYFIAIGTNGVGLHSTREPRSIGRLASHGCIRMKLDDVRHLYHALPEGTPVSTVYNLYRIERTETTVIIHAFEDVYNRMGPAATYEHLVSHLVRHGLSPAILSPAEVDRLVEGQSVVLTGFRMPAAPRIAAVTFPSSAAASSAPAAAARPGAVLPAGSVSEAACLLARAVASMPR